MAAKKSWTLTEKVKLINDFEKSGMSKSGFSKVHSVPRTTLNTILSAKEAILSNYQTGCKRKRMRTSNFEDVEAVLIKWFKNVRSNSISVSGNILKEKALEIAKELNVENFNASNGWIERFKERHGLSFKKICGESAAVDESKINSWKNLILKEILSNYKPSDIYNLDETGLFFRLQPDKTLCFRQENCSGGKKSKERLTVLLGSNMLGTDKLKPVVIGKSLKPRCFSNVKSLPVIYRANSKAWMTSTIWEETMRIFDKKFCSQKREVVFIIDNCAAHAEFQGLKAIKIVYLPPNATSVLQPLDQGIILNFKTKYRSFLIKDMIKSLDEKKEFRVTVLDAIHYIHKSWSDVSKVTINNCFKHAGFDSGSDLTEDTDDEDIPLASLFQELRKRGHLETQNDEDAYMNIDSNLQTSPEATITEIIADVLEAKNGPEVESDSDHEEEPDKPKVTKKMALECIEGLRNYISTLNETTDRDYDMLYSLEKRILFSGYNHQTKMDAFFLNQ